MRIYACSTTRPTVSKFLHTGREGESEEEDEKKEEERREGGDRGRRREIGGLRKDE